MTGELFPVVAVEQIAVDEANRWLVAWQHPLGACERPFGIEAHALVLDGQPIGVTVSASTVSATCADRPRGSLVELARIGRCPSTPWCLRPLLRLWRAVLAPRWSYWPVTAAVSYAIPGTPGDLYRFDGWRRVGEVKASGGGGTLSRTPKVNGIGDGRKTLWMFDYEAQP